MNFFPSLQNPKNLSAVLFSNANNIFLDKDLFSFVQNFKIYIKSGTKLSGDDLKQYKEHIFYIDEKNSSSKIIHKKEKDANKEDKNVIKNPIKELEKENANLKKYIEYINFQHAKFQDIISFDEFSKQIDFTVKDLKDNKENSSYEHIITQEDEKFHHVICKIGEGSTSDVYKVINVKTGEVMCKKIIKECQEESSFKILQNSLKEVEVLLEINHPCICKAIGYNIQEEIPGFNEDDNEKQKKTTIAIFYKYLPYKIKDVIGNKMINNTFNNPIIRDKSLII